MDDFGPGLLDDALQGRFPRLQRGLAVRDAPAVAGHGGFLDRRGVVGHDDEGRDSPQAGGQGQGLGVVAGGVGGHAAGGCGGVEGKDGIGRAAEFESPDFLEVLTLQKDSRAQPLVERGAGQDGRAMGVGGDAPGGGQDIGESGVGRHGDHPLSEGPQFITESALCGRGPVPKGPRKREIRTQPGRLFFRIG